MKRFFFSLIALAAVATGCTQSAMLETPDLFNTPVSFSPYTGRTPETKATQINSADALATAGGFYVYGFLNQEGKDQSVYINNEAVTMGTSGWTYNNVVYWPDASSTSTLDFVAYSANGVGKGLSDVSSTGFTFTVPDTIDEQVDLLATAYYDGKSLKTSTANVTLEFRHLLSRVSFKVETTTNKNIVVSSLSLAGKMPTEGELVFADAKVSEGKTPALTPTNKVDKEYFYYSNSTGATVTGANTLAKRIPGTEEKYLMIIPHDALEAADGQGSDHYVNITYQIGSTSAPVREASVRLPIGFEFAKGMAYEIILKISTSSISFDITEEDWNTTDKEIGPLEPDVEEEEEEEEESGPTIVNHKSASLAVSNIGKTSAILTLNALTDAYKDHSNVGGLGNVEVDDKGIGIAYRVKGSEEWTIIEYDSANYGWAKEEILTLQPATTYECCVLFKWRSPILEEKGTYLKYEDLNGYQPAEFEVSYGQDLHPADDVPETEVQFLTFTTLADTPPASVITETEFTLYDVADAELTNTTASVTGNVVLGTVDGTPIDIKEYGFCWVKVIDGDETPTTTNDRKSWNPTAAGSYDFEHTIPDLAPNTTYRFCAYIISRDPTYANVTVEGKDYTESVLIIPANTPFYSPVRTFTTKPSADEDDNTGGSWGDGGETDFE